MTSAALAGSLIDPSPALTGASGRRTALLLAIVTAASLLSTAVVVPRVDHATAVARRIDMRPGDGELTPHARDEQIATGVKVAQTGAWAQAALWPAVRALLVALVLFLGLKVAGGTPRLADALAVAAIAALPLALRDLLAIPAALARGSIPPGDLPSLVPSSLAALLPPRLPPPLARAAAGLDLFGVWSAALAALGMAHVAHVSKRRAAIAVAVLFLAGIAVLDVALPAFSSGPGPRP